MKPIHIMRWAPADYVNDPAVKLALAKRDYVSSAFYPLFLFHAFIQGGHLPAEPTTLGAILGMRPVDVRRALAYWLEQGKLKERDGQLYHERVVRDIADELAFREEQREKGKLGGRPRVVKAGPLPTRNPVVLERQSPPSPSPTPTPEPFASASPPAPLSSTRGPTNGRADELTEAKIRDSKVADERRLLALVSRLEAVDPKGRSAPDLMQLVTSYDKADGRRIGGCVNPATLSFERVRKSIADAEVLLRQWGGEADGPRP